MPNSSLLNSGKNWTNSTVSSSQNTSDITDPITSRRDASVPVKNTLTQSLIFSPYGLRISESVEDEFTNLKDMLSFTSTAGTEGKSTGFFEKIKDKIVEIVTGKNESDYNMAKPDETHEPDQGEYNGQVANVISIPDFVDTRIGCSEAINPYWQFNRDDDIIPMSLISWDGGEILDQAPSIGRGGKILDPSYGMGRVYYEKYYSRQQILWLQPSVPEYNNIFLILRHAGDSSAYASMRDGDARSIVSKLISMVWNGLVFVITLPINILGEVYSFFRRAESNMITKFYYLRPSPLMYMEAVNTMLERLATGMTLYPPVMFGFDKINHGKAAEAAEKLMTQGLDPAKVTDTSSPDGVKFTKLVNNLTEGEFKEATQLAYSGIPFLLKNGPDIFLILNRRARIKGAFAAIKDVKKFNTRAMLMATLAHFSGGGSVKNDTVASQYFNTSQDAQNWIYLFKEFIQRPLFGKGSDETKGISDDTWSWIKSLTYGTTRYFGFKIDKGFTPSESFGNQTGQMDIANRVNGFAQERVKEEMESGGSDMYEFVKRSFSSFGEAMDQLYKKAAASAASLVGGDAIKLVNAGNGYLDFPEVWESSSFSRSYSFNIQLRARYGDPVSIFQNVYIPLCMLLAMAMPRGVGDSMYTGPFYVRAFSRGMLAIPMGIIDSLSISRGSGDYAWSYGHLPTGIDVSFSIKDLSPIMFLGIHDVGLYDTFSRNGQFQDYLNTLSAIDLEEYQSYAAKSMKKLTALVKNISHTIGSLTYWKEVFRNSTAMRIFSPFLFEGHGQSDSDMMQ